MIDPEVMADIRRRINPQYQDTIGTESYERKLLVDEIDRLSDCAANCHQFHDSINEYRQLIAREIMQLVADWLYNGCHIGMAAVIKQEYGLSD